MMIGMVLRIAALSVGLSKPPNGRSGAIQAHLRVLKEVFNRWDAESQSS